MLRADVLCRSNSVRLQHDNTQGLGNSLKLETCEVVECLPERTPVGNKLPKSDTFSTLGSIK